METAFSHLLELHELALEQVQKFSRKRKLYRELKSRQQSRNFIGIVGPRGVGKSVLLRQLARQHGDQGLYLSLDSVEELDLFEIAKRADKDYRVKHLFLDEVHFIKTIDRDLKKIYDFLDIQVTFTSSVAIAMYQSSSDLSRRVELIELRPFSFAEYLEFKLEREPLPKLSFEDLTDQNWEPSHMRSSTHFYDYLRGGLMPYALAQADISTLQKNILEKVIGKDLPSIHSMRTEEIVICRKMVEFIAKSGIDGISYSSLSKNLGITKYKAEIYVDLLERAFVLHRVMPIGTNVLKEPKILMCLPYRQLYKAFDEAIGGIREDFVMDCLKISGHRAYYLKSTRGEKIPDFYIDDLKPPLVLEVGGKGKGREQFKGIKVERKLILSDGDRIAPGKVPLFLLGFLKPTDDRIG